MSGSYLLDTNIVAALFAGESSVLDRLAQADTVFLPSIVVGEIYFGAYRSGRVDKNLAHIDELVMASSVLACDTETAREYGLVKSALRSKGRPIPENDIWIAAVARQHGLALATRDSHFREIDDLDADLW
ncbi:MAG: type II toxin-antitoxin system VapC family toxin [Chloroflexi bacterium]|nr:type II toxin-antitoxin system VapC family toxin [Chloroflexota bacterium]